MNDYFDDLVALRPTDARIEAEFPKQHRAELLAGIVGTDHGRDLDQDQGKPDESPLSGRSAGSRRWWLIAGAAAATATVLVAGSLLLRTPSETVQIGSDVAPELPGWIAAPGAVDLLEPGQYQYVTGTTSQSETATSRSGNAAESGNPASTPPSALSESTIPSAANGSAIEQSERSVGETTAGPARTELPTNISETWIDRDGRWWSHQKQDGGPASYTYSFGKPAGFLNSPTPEQLRTLALDANELFEYLDNHVHGSSSREEAVYTAIADIFGSHLPTADLRAALVGAAELNPSTIVAHTSNAAGRDTVSITFADAWSGPNCTETTYLDPSTLELVGSAADCRDHHFRLSTDLPRLVDSLPDVMTRADNIANAATESAPTSVPSTFPDELGEWTSSSQPAPTTG